MKKSEVNKYFSKLCRFIDSSFSKMLDENKVEISERYDMDFIAISNDESEYEKLGRYNTGFQKLKRTKFKTTDYHNFSPTKEILSQINTAQFQSDFESSITENKSIYFSKIKKDLFLRIIGEMMMGYNNSTENWKKHHVEHLFNSLSKEQIKYENKVFLTGISAPNKQNNISFEYLGRNVEIRRPTPQEYVEKSNKLKFQFSSFTAILTVTSFGRNEKQLNIERIIQVLRLYKLGSISNLGSEQTSYYKNSHSSTFPGYFKHNYFTYNLTKRERIDLATLILNIYDRLENISKLKFKKKIKASESMDFCLKVAIDRYEESLLARTGDQDKRLTFAIMGLEAIYNLDSEKQLIAFKLKLRVAKIMGIFGLDPFEVSSNLTKAYDVRSKFAHGTITNNDIDFDFERNIINYLRISILYFLHYTKSKQDFVSEINKTFISELSNVEFKRELLLNYKTNKLKKYCP